MLLLEAPSSCQRDTNRPRTSAIPAHRTKPLIYQALTFAELAKWINPIVADSVNYYGRFYRSTLFPLLMRINAYLVRWIRDKYKRLRRRRKAFECMRGIAEQHRRMFAHWTWVTAASLV